ncbi:MAG: ATP-binding protein [Smithella sp.]|nr:ATP-binding protein [Smithella sp.]
MFRKIIQQIKAYNDTLTVRVRLMILTILGLALTMAIWGIIQLTALEGILVSQQVKRLEDVAETVSTFYQHFPTRQGLRALDSALKDHVQTDVRLARIDIFDTAHKDVDYVAGASRVQYEWPDDVIAATGAGNKQRYVKIDTESGPALGLLYPVSGETKRSQLVVGVIGFSRSNMEIMNRARILLIFSSAGLLILILLIFGLSYRWIIEKPLKAILQAIDEFQKRQYKNRLSIVHNDEWGQISRHFNVMADEIQDVMNSNLELNKNLADRVREETLKVVQLQKQVADLKQLTTLGQLTANLAHDLGTPLHSIGGLAKLLLERGGWPQDVEHKLNLIVQQTQRLDHVIQNVRKATRLPEPHFEVLTVQQILSETVPLVEPFVHKNNVSIKVDVGHESVPLYVDRYRIQTAIMNIIQNAQEAMPQGGEISVTAQTVSPDNFVTLMISDNGPGMTSDMIEKASEPFFSTKQNEGMRGLGLAIVRDIMKTHGGKMEIKSSPDTGTSVILYLPMFKDNKRVV